MHVSRRSHGPGEADPFTEALPWLVILHPSTGAQSAKTGQVGEAFSFGAGMREGGGAFVKVILSRAGLAC